MKRKYSSNDTVTFEQVKEKALRLIEFRSHSEKELRDKLKIFGAQESDIEKVCHFCEEFGFLNDRTYAVSKARDMFNLKKYGKKRIEQELYSKGIDSQIISDVMMDLSEEFDDEKNQEKLQNLIEKKLHQDFEKKNREKCIRYFLYRGYSLDEIKRCMEAVVEKHGKEHENGI